MRLNLAIAATLGAVVSCSAPDPTTLDRSASDGANAPPPQRSLDEPHVPRARGRTVVNPVSTAAPAVPRAAPLASGVSINELDVLQGVKIAVWTGGAPVSTRRAQ